MKNVKKFWVIYDLNDRVYVGRDTMVPDSKRIEDAEFFNNELDAIEWKNNNNSWRLDFDDFSLLEKYCPPDWDFEAAELQGSQMTGPLILKEIEIHYDDSEENA